MAVDTAAKRVAATRTYRRAGAFPQPDGTIARADRASVTIVYLYLAQLTASGTRSLLVGFPDRLTRRLIPPAGSINADRRAALVGRYSGITIGTHRFGVADNVADARGAGVRGKIGHGETSAVADARGAGVRGKIGHGVADNVADAHASGRVLEPTYGVGDGIGWSYGAGRVTRRAHGTADAVADSQAHGKFPHKQIANAVADAVGRGLRRAWTGLADGVANATGAGHRTHHATGLADNVADAQRTSPHLLSARGRQNAAYFPRVPRPGLPFPSGSIDAADRALLAGRFAASPFEWRRAGTADGVADARAHGRLTRRSSGVAGGVANATGAGQKFKIGLATGVADNVASATGAGVKRIILMGPGHATLRRGGTTSTRTRRTATTATATRTGTTTTLLGDG